MARWKVINKDKAEEIAISEATPDSEGYIRVNTAKIPKGLSVEQVIEFAEKMGIILEVDNKNS